MSSRSRTALFLQLRQSAPSSNLRNHPILDSEKVGLITSHQGNAHQDQRQPPIPKDLPPTWIKLVNEVEATITRIQQQLAHLESLHKKQLLPGFDDRADTESSINQSNISVTATFRQCQKQVQQFQAAIITIAGHEASPHELKLHKNIATALATRVSTLSAQFRKLQSNYLARLKSRAVKSSTMFSLSDMEEDLVFESPRASAFTQAHDQQLNQNEKVIHEREQEIEGISKTIGDVAELFRDIQSMVVEQGSLLDRIDQNLTVAASNVERGNEELNHAQKYQVASRKKMLIFLLILAILFIIILLAIRRKS